MNFQLREAPADYQAYQFPYTIWQEWTPGQPLQPLYANGMLPFSANPDDPSHQFYMARSLRVDLANLQLSKSRRYEYRQWQELGLSRDCIATATFQQRHPDAAALALQWMQLRNRQPYLSPQRLDYIMAKPFVSTILCWYKDTQLQAFAPLVPFTDAVHYWFVFYQPHHDNCSSGSGLLTDFLLWAQASGLRHAYTGTAYGMKSHYKFKGLNGCSFWNGNQWVDDRKLLQHLIGSDA